jgi:hypothetical protein
MAALTAENIDWVTKTLNYSRKKTKQPVHLVIGVGGKNVICRGTANLL